MQNKPVALVTGSNQGIGLQIAKDLMAHGFTVLVGSRNLENGERAAQSIGAAAHALQLDVTDAASIAAAAERVREEFGRLDVLVNNAAISHAGRPGRSLEEMIESNRPSVASLDEVRKVWETNVFGVLAVTQAMLPLLREAPAARIVNVGNGAGSLTLKWKSARAQSVAAYAGLAPREQRSGTSVRKATTLSKRGNSRLRKAFYFPAVSAMPWNPVVKAHYERLREKGKPKMVA